MNYQLHSASTSTSGFVWALEILESPGKFWAPGNTLKSPGIHLILSPQKISQNFFEKNKYVK